jgi:hypothetical protein
MSASPIMVRQYLLFDPLPEAQARKLLDDLILRMPVLAFKERVSYEVPHAWIEKREDFGVHNITAPALIASHLEPKAAAAYVYSSSHREATDFLESKLAACPVVSDERIRAAIDLANASRNEALPRSIFLSWLTILDSLVTRKERPVNVCNWLEEKITEAHKLKEPGLAAALGNLKHESHSSAIRHLIEIAGRAIGEDEAQVKAQQVSATQLYRIRSGLSHSGTTMLDPANVNDACALARFVLETALQYPNILEE